MCEKGVVNGYAQHQKHQSEAPTWLQRLQCPASSINPTNSPFKQSLQNLVPQYRHIYVWKGNTGVNKQRVTFMKRAVRVKSARYKAYTQQHCEMLFVRTLVSNQKIKAYDTSCTLW